MRVALLAGAGSIHTIRWANGLVEAGVEVHLITQHQPIEPTSVGVRVHQWPYRGNIGYFLMVPEVKAIIKKIDPDILNAHYASGYGTTARLVGFRPWLLSVWGSDVYDVPGKSRVHRYLVRKNLLAATGVASTSRCMAERTRSLAPEIGEIAITPFGVDMAAYEAVNSLTSAGGEDSGGPIVIGTVKRMAEKYGIDTLMRAFEIARKRLESEGSALASRLRLRLVGDGPEMGRLQALARDLGIADITTFVGRVPHAEVPGELGELDIYVALSRWDSESFGVAILEAGASGRPVVVSDSGGLPEVTVEGETGLIVPREDPDSAASAILRLVRDPMLRARMGTAAREYVGRRYNWPACVGTMIDVYKNTIDAAAKS